MKYSDIFDYARQLIPKKDGLDLCVDYLEQYVLRNTDTYNELISIRSRNRDNQRSYDQEFCTDKEFRAQQNRLVNQVLTLLSENRSSDFSVEPIGELTWHRTANFYKKYFSNFDSGGSALPVPIYVSPPYSINWRALASKHREQHESLKQLGRFFPSTELTQVSLDQHLLNFLHDPAYRHENDIQYSYQKLIIVTGKPGSGKTTLCQNLIKQYYFSDKAEEQEQSLLLYLKLRELPAKLTSKNDFVLTVCEELSNRLRADISFYSEDRSILFVLDGLDEIMMREGFSQEDAKGILRKVITELKKSQNTYVIISCRTEYLDLSYEIELDSLFALRLDPFSIKEQDLWFEKYAATNKDDSWSVERLQKIRTIAPSVVQELFDQPLLLTLIAKDPQIIAGDALNQNGVFRKIIDRVIDRELRERSAFSKKSNRQEILEALETIAFRMSCNSTGYVLSRSETLELWERCVPPVATTNEKVEKELRDILIGNFYLRSISNNYEGREDQVEFVHNSFREYLTAQYIFRVAKKEFSGDDLERDHLKWLFEKIGEISPTPALIDFLVELIEYEDQHVLDQLSKNMERVLDKLLLHDFVDSAEFASFNPPIRRAMQAFYYFWIIYGRSKKNDLIAGADGRANERFKELIKYVAKISSYRLSFRGAKLVGIDMSGCHLNTVDFENAVLFNARFNGCLIDDSNFSGADLRGCTMNGSSLTGVSFQNGIILSKDSYLHKVEEDENPTALVDGSFRYTEFDRVDFTGADLTNCDFYFADMRGVQLNPTQIAGAILSGVKVDSQDWVYSQLEHDDPDQESEYPLGYKVSDLPMLDQEKKEYYLMIREEDELIDKV